MFLPPYILTRLSPSATRIYLTFFSATDRNNLLEPISIPIRRLARGTGYSRRACTLALSQLRSFKLIEQLPRRYHAPAAYIFLAPPTEAQMRSLQAQPIAPVNDQKPTSDTPKRPSRPSDALRNSAPTKAQPIAPLSPRAQRLSDKVMRNPKLLRAVYNHFTPSQRTRLIDRAAKTLARLISEEKEIY